MACEMDFLGSWEDKLSLVEFTYNSSYQQSINMAPFQALHERKCQLLLCWEEIREQQLIEPESVQMSIDVIIVIKKQLKTT